MKVITRSEEETIKVAEELARRLDRGYLLLLSGELGAGKTRFVQGVAKGLGISDAVTSPTFTIVNEYRGRLPLFHIDLYRLERFPEEDIDLDEMLEKGVAAVEWWEKDKNFFEQYGPRVTVSIRVVSESEREIEIAWEDSSER